MPSGSSRGAALAVLALLSACGAPDRPRGAGRGRVVSDVPVKVGAPYRAGGRMWVPADERNYDAVGLASWYGGAHRGRPTANGERFDPAGISAAHTTLPLPSYVEVTALGTGRVILVRVNDRGPFTGGRIIDLSQGAARLLGVERAGVARVAVRRVEPDERDRAALRAGHAARTLPARDRAALLRLNARFRGEVGEQSGVAPRSPRKSGAAAVPVGPVFVASPPPEAGASKRPPADAAGSGAYFVQVAALDDADRADGLVSALGSIGSAWAIAEGSLWHVRFGPFADETTALSALARAYAAGYQDARVVRESAP